MQSNASLQSLYARCSGSLLRRNLSSSSLRFPLLRRQSESYQCKLSLRKSSTNGSAGSSSSSSSTTTTTSKTMKFDNKEDRVNYLRKANDEMEKYHQTRLKMQRGELGNKNPYKAGNASNIQLAIVGLFLAVFFSMPSLGRKIAQDDEFRSKYIPSWYDYTIEKPEYAWTREELTAQIERIQMEMHNRAAAGEFTTDKLNALEQRLNNTSSGDSDSEKGSSSVRATKTPSESDKEATRRAGWDRIHPGMEDDEEFTEE